MPGYFSRSKSADFFAPDVSIIGENASHYRANLVFTTKATVATPSDFCRILLRVGKI